MGESVHAIRSCGIASQRGGEGMSTPKDPVRDTGQAMPHKRRRGVRLLGGAGPVCADIRPGG